MQTIDILISQAYLGVITPLIKLKNRKIMANKPRNKMHAINLEEFFFLKNEKEEKRLVRYGQVVYVQKSISKSRKIIKN